MKNFFNRLKILAFLVVLYGIWSFFVSTHSDKMAEAQKGRMTDKVVMSDETAEDYQAEAMEHYREASKADTKEENWSLATKEANRLVETRDFSAYEKEVNDLDMKKVILKSFIGE